ncbi:MAG: GGDEF domain-containing protein [Planctomycetes bacterium]|nr:GGDEF domain-containing protein [Planctomycetota bacterium]
MAKESTLVGLRRYAGVKTILLQNSPETLFKPQLLERTFMLVLLPMFAAACVIMSLVSIFMENATWFERWQLIPTAVVFLGLLVWAIKCRPGCTRYVRLATLFVGATVVMERMFLGMWLTYRYGLEPDYISGMVPWAILGACLFVFMLYRRSLVAGFAYYAAGAVGILVFLAVNPHPLPAALEQDLTINYLVATPVFLVMMAGFSRLRLAYGTALTKAEDFESMAMQDQLTGLFNRRAFSASMRRARARQARKGTAVSVIMCDIDHFKRINDTYGHETGDKVLIELSQILSNTMRRTDDVFRWGGEEFLILMEETNLKQACEVAERLRALVEESKILRSGLTASFGVTELVRGEDDTDFFNRVDLALYDAKEHGRNMVVMRRRVKPTADPRVGPIAELIESPDFTVS